MVLTDEELVKVTDFMAEQFMATGRFAFDDEEILEATGIAIAGSDSGILKVSVMRKLAEIPGGLEKMGGEPTYHRGEEE